MGALEYSIFPHARRPQCAELMDIYARIGAGDWVREQIKENSHDSGPLDATCLGDIADVSRAYFP